MRKYALLAASVAIPALVVVGCGTTGSSSNTGKSGSSGNVTNITIWDDYSSAQPAGKAFNTLVDEFNKSHPNIHVTAQYITVGDNMLPKIMTALAGNQEPDMVAGGYPTWGPGLLDSGKVVTLDSYLKNSKTLHASDFYPGMLNVSSYKGKVLSIPNDGGDYGIFYNKNIFTQAGLNPNKPPQTWSELLKDAQQIKQKTGNWGFYVPIGNTEWTVWTFEGMLWGNGGTFIDTSGPKAKVEFNSPAGVQALQMWVDMIHKYKVAQPTAYPITTQTSDILEKGNVGMVIDGPWDVAPLNKANFPLGTTMFPQGTSSYSTNLGTDTFFIFKTGKAKQDASWQFIEWFMKPSRLAQWDINASFLPTLTSVVNTPAYAKFLKDHPDMAPLVENLKYAHGRPSLKSYNAISTELGNQIEAALYGQVSAKQALDTAATKAEQILQQNGE
ncbi:extracellular solute-binding protein [Alicyclobacillus curvatus]|jgi:multiple sugar transport system substrate-binding protein|nr:extracellular solute-binding protein [Alicyclobacillus curvatus]